MPVPLQAHSPGGSWLAVERPGQDYPMGVERKDILILPGAQIYSKLGEERHSLGEGHAWPKAPTLTSSGSTLKSVCSTTPKSCGGSSLGRVRSMRMQPPPGDSANMGDGQGGHWGL